MVPVAAGGGGSRVPPGRPVRAGRRTGCAGGSPRRGPRAPGGRRAGPAQAPVPRPAGPGAGRARHPNRRSACARSVTPRSPLRPVGAAPPESGPTHERAVVRGGGGLCSGRRGGPLAARTGAGGTGRERPARLRAGHGGRPSGVTSRTVRSGSVRRAERDGGTQARPGGGTRRPSGPHPYPGGRNVTCLTRPQHGPLTRDDAERDGSTVPDGAPTRASAGGRSYCGD